MKQRTIPEQEILMPSVQEILEEVPELPKPYAQVIFAAYASLQDYSGSRQPIDLARMMLRAMKDVQNER